MSHPQLKQLIKKSAKQYLKQAGTYGKLLKDFHYALEKILIEATLSHFEGNISLSAKALGISRTSLYKKIALYKITS